MKAWRQVRRGLIGGGAAAMTVLLAAGQATAESTYLDVVRKYADTLIDKARDTYGPVKSGLILSAFDRTTLKPLTTRPASPGGIRRGDRSGPIWEPLTGANPQLDENLLRILYTLSELTGDKRYAQAADAELKWFFENAQSPKTGLLCWGEHLAWETMTDKPISGGDESMHEFARPWMLWDRCFALAPEPSRKFAVGLWEHQIANHETGAYDRHAPFATHGPKNGMDFPRHGGFYIGTWSSAYKHTQDPVFLKAIETILNRFESKRHPKTGFMPWCCDRTFGGPGLGEAIDCYAAAANVPDPLASRLKAFATREDELFFTLPHDPKGKGFAHTVDLATGKPTEDGIGTRKWLTAYGGGTTASFAMGCVGRYEQTHDKRYADLIVSTADGYLNSWPEEDVDIWPLAFAHAVSLEVAAFRLTGKTVYLDQARQFAKMAVEIFWQDNPLPRASFKTGHYEAITGGDSLALALLQLHAALNSSAVEIPSNTIDR
jgi:hypothetical protein